MGREALELFAWASFGGQKDAVMFRVVGLQVLATGLVASIAWLWAGQAAGLSALAGGAACFVPNGLFALRLAISARRPQGASAGTFFVGEFVKISSTIAVLALIAWAWKDVVWLAMIVSIIITLKSYLIALIWS